MPLLENFSQPLAELIRPSTLRDYVGQEHLINHSDGAISSFIAMGTLPSMLLYGPPGVGKTTLAHILATETNYVFMELSATDSTVSDMRQILLAIRQENTKRTRLRLPPLRVVVFIDEIHRFSSTQQDFLLPFVESGDFVFIGATTVNPNKRIRKAIMSRCHMFQLQALRPEHVIRVLHRASLYENIRRKSSRGLKFIHYGEGAFELVAKYANGDTRTAINFVELLSSRMDGLEWKLLDHSDSGLVDLETVDQTIKALTKVRLGLQNDQNVPLIIHLFNCMNGVTSTEQVEPEKPQYVSTSRTATSFVVRIKLAKAAAVASDLESDVDEPQLHRECALDIVRDDSKLSDWIDHIQYSDDSDTEPGEIYSDDEYIPTTSRISRSKHQNISSVHAVLQLLRRGEAPMFLLKQLILYACIYVDSDLRELPRVVAAKKSLEHALVDEKIVLSQCVERLTSMRKLRGVSIVKQIRCIKDFLSLCKTTKEKVFETKLDFNIVFDESLTNQLMAEPIKSALAADIFTEMPIVAELGEGYSIGLHSGSTTP